MSVVAYCRRSACTARPEETLREAAVRMEKEGVGLLVVTEEDAPVGVLTDRDLMRAVAAEGHDAGQARIRDAMSQPAVAVADDAPLEDALTLMGERRVRRLPVLDERERLVGLVSADDLTLLLAREIGGLGDVLVAQLPPGASRAAGHEEAGAARRVEHYAAPVVCAALDDAVETLAREMESQAVGSVVVIEDGRAVGLVTDRDLALRVVAQGLDPRATRASAVMSTPLVSVAPEDPLEEVVARMRSAGVRRMPILRDGRPVGLVSFDDLLVAFGRELDRLGRCVAGEVRAARLRTLSSRLLRDVEDRLEDAGAQLRRFGDQTLRGLGRELEDAFERVTGRREEAPPRRELRVRDLMQTDLRRCTPEDALAEAARIMWERDCGCVPVVAADGSGRLVGMLTDRDACMAAWSKDEPLARIRVGDAMATRLHVCRPEDPLHHAEALMRTAQLRRLPVVDAAGHLRGLIALADLAEAATGAHGVPLGAVPAAEVGALLEAICRPRSALAPR